MSDVKVGEIQKVDIHVRSNRSPITTKLHNLEVGEGFEVKGVERGSITVPAAAIKRNTGKTFGTRLLGPLHFLAYRKS